MWQVEIVPLVRMLINDIDGTTYDACRLEEVIILSAHIAVTELDITGTYTVNLTDQTISPDPTEGTKDPGITNLIALKTAYFILKNEAKAAGRLGIKITDGPSNIDLTGKIQYLGKAADDMLWKYEKTRLEYMAGNSKAGEAIMTPFTNENVPVQDSFR